MAALLAEERAQVAADEAAGTGPQEEFFSGKKGSIILTESLRDVVIRFFMAADGSTMLHEGGHLWLAQLEHDAKQPRARAGIKRDLAILREWFGLAEGQEIGDAEHERFAKAVELYLMEGKAPSIQLEAPFQSFVAWLVHVYGSLKNRYFQNVKLTDPVRQVLDRMLATDKQIREAQRARGMGQTVLGVENGLSKEQAEALRASMLEGRRQASTRNVAMHIRMARRRAAKEWKRLAKEVQREVAATVDDMPVMQARQWLRSGKPREGQSFPTLVAKIPHQRMSKKGMLAASPGRDKNILNVLRAQSGYWQKDGGYHPDVVAELFGFSSGTDMLRQMAAVDSRDVLISRLTKETMERRHGLFESSLSLASPAVVSATKRLPKELIPR